MEWFEDCEATLESFIVIMSKVIQFLFSVTFTCVFILFRYILLQNNNDIFRYH